VTIWNNREALHQSHLVEYVNVFNPFTQASLQQLAALGFSEIKSFGLIYGTVINQAFMLATNDIFRGSAWIFMFLLALVWFAKPTFMKAGGPMAAE